ncbi:TetR/AcrR family transcriptional regulator [Microbacterium sp. ZW T5_45]|uniref:TetR/AcrR family transcriptional regulator n=1 Tax=Microbacterium sp. ZW T5_45 TaxID=3378080 RepID=UPI0038527602
MTTTRQARTAATRERILSSARELFVSRGYRSTSLRDIAAAASVSHPAVLGHFASKDDLLAEVVAQFEQENDEAFSTVVAAAEPGSLIFSELAERNAATPGYLELFTALIGEASTPDHPTHQRMRERYAQMRELASDILADAEFHGVIAPDRDPEGETFRHMAIWDGLQLMAQYLPERVDVVEHLAEMEDLWATPWSWREPDEGGAADPPAGPLPTLIVGAPREADAAGYAAGRRRRTQIVSDAMHLFARQGYGDTSLRDIADAAGVSKSTLLHHYATKEALLLAVLTERDEAIQQWGAMLEDSSAVEVLRRLPEGAVHNADDEPGLVEVYAVLSCEAVPVGHPAHAYFTSRFAHSIDYFAELFRLAQEDGDLPSHRDPVHEGIRLIALWDGLQYQWLYDRDAVDVAEQLRLHLVDVLPARG